jgi:hypothetical protein
MRAAKAAGLSILASVLLLASAASAHPETRAFCSVHRVLGGIRVELEVPIHRAAADPALSADLLAHMRATTPRGACQARAGPLGLMPVGAELRATLTLHWTCPAGPVTLHNDWGLERDPASQTLCAIEGAPWVFARDRRSVQLAAPPRALSSFLEFLQRGALQLLGRAEQLVFLLVLLVVTASGAERSLRSRLSTSLGIAAGFALGHSSTLWLGSFGLVRVDERWIGGLIALSILVIALENVLIAVPRWRPFNAALFGLVHGFALTSVLARAPIPEGGLVWALLGWNLGIELTQLALVLLLAPVFFWLGRHARARGSITLPLSIAAAALAALWFLEWATEARLPGNGA